MREVKRDETKDSHLSYDGFKQRIYRSTLLKGDTIELLLNGNSIVSMNVDYDNNHFHLTVQSKTSKKEFDSEILFIDNEIAVLEAKKLALETEK